MLKPVLSKVGVSISKFGFTRRETWKMQLLHTIKVKPKSGVNIEKTDRTNLYFILLKLFLSLDFGFIKYTSLKQKIIINVISISIGLTISAVTVTYMYIYMNGPEFIWYTVLSIQYGAYVLTLLFSNGKHSFSSLLDSLQLFDSTVGLDISLYNSKKVVSISVFIIIVYRFFNQFTYCYFLLGSCIANTFISIVVLLVLLASDVVLIVYCMVFYFAYQRLERFTVSVKDSNDLVICQVNYKFLVDCTEKTKNSFDLMYIVSLLFNVPELLTAVFSLVLLFTTESKEVWSSAFATMWWCLRILIVTFSPAFAAGMLADQVQALKLVLHERLLQERDWNQCKELKKFIDYIDIRPLRFSVCKVIPLNWNLPVIIVNIIVSYLIVMVQFSNLSFHNLI